MDPPVIDKPRGTPQDRVLRRLPDVFTDECWEWPGSRNGAGYAVIRRGGKQDPNTRVSNVVFEMFHGPIPPEHRLIRHTCHNPPCVNPNHLISGTDEDNMRDKMLAGRAGRKLTPDDIRAIRAEPRGGQTLASKYGVSCQTIKMIRRRKTWDWIH